MYLLMRKPYVNWLLLMYPILHKLYYAYQYTINDTIKLHNYYYHEAYVIRHGKPSISG